MNLLATTDYELKNAKKYIYAMRFSQNWYIKSIFSLFLLREVFIKSLHNHYYVIYVVNIF